jgi:hypothetical protein
LASFEMTINRGRSGHGARWLRTSFQDPSGS